MSTSSRTRRVALIQIASPDDEARDDRIARVEAILRRTRDVDLFVLPELWSAGYFSFERYDELAEPFDGPTVSMARRVARDLGSAIHLGSFVERDADGALHNTAVLVDARGGIAQVYRKIHVFGYQSLESQLLAPGTALEVTASPFGAIASTTCYDLRFPGLWQELSVRGAETVVVPAAWPAVRREHWCLLTQARAVEHQLWVIAVNACGRQGDVQLGGFSRLVDPAGRVVAECGDGEEVLVAELDPVRVAEARAEFPVIADRLSPADYAALGSAGSPAPGPTIRVSAVVLRDREGRVLTVRKRGTGALMLPGGKHEPGENPRDTAVRELAEELGVALDADHLRQLGVFRAAAANEPGHVVEATVFEHPLPSDVERIAPLAEIEHLEWVDPRVSRPDMAPLNTEFVFPLLA